jgi:hypothetical protein
MIEIMTAFVKFTIALQFTNQTSTMLLVFNNVLRLTRLFNSVVVQCQFLRARAARPEKASI